MVKLSFSDDLTQRLQALPSAMSKPILTKALKAGAAVIQPLAASLAPRSSPDDGQPGHLGDNIGISVARKVEGRAVGETEAAVAVGPTSMFWWGIVQEYGPHDGRYSAHPFMRPAVDSGGEAAIQIVINDLWESLRAAAEKGFGASFTPGSTSGGGGLL